MKTIVIFSITVLYLTTSGSGRAGSPEAKSGAAHGTVQLFTDRTLYVTGEAVQFSAIHRNEKDSGERILYLELITPEGKKVSGGKFLLNHGMAGGCLYLPDAMLTGLYYIRAYTRSMRNAGPSAYDYVPIRVINPLRSELQASGTGEAFVAIRDSVSPDYFELSNLRPQYKTREHAEINLRCKVPEAFPAKGMCITVVPEGTVDVASVRWKFFEYEKPVPGQHFTETWGISLTGRLMDKDQKSPVPDHVVTLSVMGIKDFSAYRTDRNGRFFFTLPDDTGEHDIFLSSADFGGSGVSLLIDNDFCSIPVKLPNPEFNLSEEEKEIALNLAVNKRITSTYLGGQVSRNDTVTGQMKAFYGEPTRSLIMDRFIQLPTFEEYFDELPLEIKVREGKDGKYFKFLSSEAGMLVNDPLIMVDWVVIADINKVLSISPQKISKIEIVNKPYVKGNLTYGGILSILSRDGDFAGIDLPGSGLFVKYDFLAPACPARYSVSDHTNLPDSRNTLLWLPDYKPDPGHENKIVFNMPDTPGRYRILIRGVFQDGRVFSHSAPFGVSGN